MNYKKLKEILLKYYTIDSVKHMLRRNNANKPSFEKAEILYKNHKIPFEAWINIRAWLDAQEQKANKKEKK